ncbi:MAG: hypothetical protein WAU07_05335 [Microgenomates group bacterium]
MKTLFLSFAWIMLAVGVSMTSIASVQFYQNHADKLLPKPTYEQGVVISTSLDPRAEESLLAPEIDSVMETGDARAQIVANFLERYNSPLKPYDHYGKAIVEISDRYDVDFRLLPSIAMQESNLCKAIPPDSYNCLGFGVHSRGTLKFNSYEEGFERAARELKANYIDEGRTTPELIERKYTPSSNGSWSASVNQWMTEMRYDDRVLGQTQKTDADLLEFTSDDL